MLRIPHFSLTQRLQILIRMCMEHEATRRLRDAAHKSLKGEWEEQVTLRGKDKNSGQGSEKRYKHSTVVTCMNKNSF